MSVATTLLWSAILLWLMIVAAAVLRFRAWTPAGTMALMSNREALTAPTGLDGRADRAAKNMIENLVLFIAVGAAAYFSGAESDQTRLGAAIFFWTRVAYWPVYLAGVPVIRTALWATGIVGIAIMAIEIL